jgi:hypothetical protein
VRRVHLGRPTSAKKVTEDETYLKRTIKEIEDASNIEDVEHAQIEVSLALCDAHSVGNY